MRGARVEPNFIYTARTSDRRASRWDRGVLTGPRRRREVEGARGRRRSRRESWEQEEREEGKRRKGWRWRRGGGGRDRGVFGILVNQHVVFLPLHAVS